MKKFIAPLVILLLQLPSFADTAVENLLVRRQGDNVNIRVTVSNPGAETQAGPVVVTLFARQGEGSEWVELTSWDNIAKIPKGHRVSRDYFDANNVTLKDYATSGDFEVRAVVKAPGGAAEVEKISTFESESGQ